MLASPYRFCWTDSYNEELSQSDLDGKLLLYQMNMYIFLFTFIVIKTTAVTSRSILSTFLIYLKLT